MKFVKLKELCDLQNGFAFKSDDYIDKSNTLVCRMSNIRPNSTFDIEYNPKYVPDEFAKKYSDYVLKDGDLIIAMTDMANDPKILGVPTIVETKGYNLLLNQRVGKLCKINTDLIYLPYLKIALARNENKAYFKRFSGGGLQLNVGKNDILGITVPLPSLPEQKHITEVLSKAEALIAERKQSIQLLDEYLKSTFFEMFGDPVKNEKGFPIRKLSDFYINRKEGTKCGPFGSALKKNEYRNSGVPVWIMDNISKSGEFVSDNCLWIDNSKYDELQGYNVIDDDIIISRAGTVGKMCVVKTDYKRSIISTNLIRLRLNNDLLPLHFVSLMKYSVERIAKLRTGAEGTFTHMNTGILDGIIFPYPPIQLQIQFAAIVEKTEALKAQYKEHLQSLEQMYGALSQRVFRGR